MSQTGSVTHWIAQLKAGEPRASQEVWERYFERLVRLARKKLGRTPRRAADEEDAVISAFNGFLRGVEERRFPRLDDRDDLWRVYNLDLDTPHGQTGKLYKPVDENDQNYARVPRLTSCYEASVGRYQSELRGAFTNNFSASDKFDSAVSHFYAQSVSQQQFGSCSTN